MKRFPRGEQAPPQACRRFADDIALLDESAEPETPERAAARAHLATCARCQRERHAQLETSAALRRHVDALMVQAPSWSAAEIAQQAQAGAHTQRATSRATMAQRQSAHMIIASATRTPAAPRDLRWRHALSAAGSVAAVALVTSLLALALTGHLLGNRPSARHNQTTPSGTPAPLSALTVYAPALPGPHSPPGLVAYRASDGAPESVSPQTPVAQWGALIAQGVRYAITAHPDGVDVTSTSPLTLTATRLSDGKSLWAERIDAVWSPDLSLVDGVLYFSSYASDASPVGVDATIRAVYAYRASDGARLWMRPLKGAPRGPLVVAQGVVYVVAGETALALSASDGAIRWQASLATGGQQIIAAWPTVSDGALYLYASLTSPTGQKDDFGAVVFALRLGDGAVSWHVTLGSDLFPALGSFAPVVAGGVVYVRLASGTFTSPDITLRLLALRATDGSLLWRFISKRVESGNMGIPNIYPPAVAQGVVYVTEDGGYLTALHADRGSVLWRVNIDATPGQDTYPYSISSPVAADGALFAIVDNQLVAARASDGAVLWRASCAMPNSPERYPPVVGR